MHLYKNETKKATEIEEEKSRTNFTYDFAKEDEQESDYCKKCKYESKWCKHRKLRDDAKGTLGNPVTST